MQRFGLSSAGSNSGRCRSHNGAMSDRVMTRREVLVAGAGAVLALPRALRAKASQPSTPVNFAMPAGACDCHTHIHGDPQRFPFYFGQGLHAGNRAAGGDDHAARSPEGAARGHRHAERLRHRQLGDALRHAGARRRRTRCRGDRRVHAGARARRDAPRRRARAFVSTSRPLA